jgi:hypothetical protein
MPFRRNMRRMALFGTAMALMLTLAIVVPAFAAQPNTIPPLKDHHRTAPPLTKGMVLTISGSGTAFKIGNQSKTESASISLTATVERVSFGRALLNFTGGTLSIGSTTYTVVGGHGILNFHSDKMVLHVTLKDSAGKHVHLILHGRNAHVPSPFNAGDHFTVDFAKHQSKLAHQWFLDLKAAVTRS